MTQKEQRKAHCLTSSSSRFETLHNGLRSCERCFTSVHDRKQISLPEKVDRLLPGARELWYDVIGMTLASNIEPDQTCVSHSSLRSYYSKRENIAVAASVMTLNGFDRERVGKLMRCRDYAVLCHDLSVDE